MFNHHEQSLSKLTNLLSTDPSYLAIITSGSLANGSARETSDVDVYLVVTDEAYEARAKNNELFYYNKEICDYPEGYIDGKIITKRFLEAASQHGSEPTRSSFSGSAVVFSRIPDLQALVSSIAIYPEANRDRNLVDFYAQVLLYGHYFAGQAIHKNNPYLLTHSISSLVLFAGRMVLAHNRILFPCHKSFMAAVEQAPDKPERFIELAYELLAKPDYDKCQAFTGIISSFFNTSLTSDQAVSLFVTNNEWNWMEQEPPLSDR